MEFGRLDNDVPTYLTLGCGLYAVHGRPKVELWPFITDQRVGQELHLVSADRVALTRERLEAAVGTGRVYKSADEYRREVDRRLFRLGSERYGALIDTLIKLRQPQLSKKPDEATLSKALTEAMPELPRAFLNDIATAMNELDLLQEEQQQIQQVHHAVEQFNGRYRTYAQGNSRRCAAVVRRAQTEHDKQSQAVNRRREACEQERSSLDSLRASKVETDQQLSAARVAYDELASDPAMQDARRLTDLESAQRERELDAAEASTRIASLPRSATAEREELARREQDEREHDAEAARDASRASTEASDAGLASEYAAMRDRVCSLLARGGTYDELRTSCESAADRRRAQVDMVRAAVRKRAVAEREVQHQVTRRDERAIQFSSADGRCTKAVEELDGVQSSHLSDWSDHLASLTVASLDEPDVAMEELHLWVESLSDAHPVRERMLRSTEAKQRELTIEQSALRATLDTLDAEASSLHMSHADLARGAQIVPEHALRRDLSARATREGAPFWRAVEFRDDVSPEQRAALEAACEISGLLDAWITKDGVLLRDDTQDVWLRSGPARAQSLLRWLVPSGVEGTDGDRIAELLGCIDSSDHEPQDSDTWISASGQFHLGKLRGNHEKSHAVFLGNPAREAARIARLEATTVRLAELEAERSSRKTRLSEIDELRLRAMRELESSPRDEDLRQKHANLEAAAELRREATDAFDAAEREVAQASLAAARAQEALTSTACDLRLPEDAESLNAVQSAAERFRSAAAAWIRSSEHAAKSVAQLDVQKQRTAGLEEQLEAATLDLRARETRLDDVVARYASLKARVGESVETLHERLRDGRASIELLERELKALSMAIEEAIGEAAAREEQLRGAQVDLEGRATERLQAIRALQKFAGTGLLSTALPELELPKQPIWTVEAALTLARAIESRLETVACEGLDWERIRKEIAPRLTVLSSSLSALGHRAEMEQSDFGMVVQIVYGNRSERPEVLERVLAAEMEERRGILSAREREILENHLQAEVALSIQRLLRQGEERVTRINAELERHPTSTGIYFKLVWAPMTADEAGVPTGFERVRNQLLRRTAAAWSKEDRAVVGAFLHGRIQSERDKGDGAPLLELLGRALDYRSWHQYRVMRWQDGDFRPLSGPASSGERALGLTVPLFAAVSSHYESGATSDAPRLVLLDEAFAGIDDEARSHCMALIREFDLDFIMTSEREWGCYETLPGVAICHLQRRAGVDAIHVSRWTWDGRQRRRAPAPRKAHAPSL